MDVANVMGSRPDGWWRDRAGAAVRLHAELAGLAASGRAVLPAGADPGDAGPEEASQGKAGQRDAGQRDAGQRDAGQRDGGQPSDPPGFVMVLEGAARAAAARIEAAEADDPGARGRIRVLEARGSGDDAIVALVRELPGRRVVVTADRELRDRSIGAGATVLGPAWLLGLLRQ